MMKLAGIALVFSVGSAGLLLGCEHKNDKPKGGAATATPPAPKNDMPPEAVKKDPGLPPAAAKAVDGELRAPTAADLATYTQDISGTGKLTAVIEVATGEGGAEAVGTFHCELYGDKAPMTVANFVGLATGKKAWMNPKSGTIEKSAYFDGLLFHRVIAGFMIQGGDPLGVGRGGPGYTFGDETQNDLRMAPGILAMANAGASTNGSQFFIVEGQPDHLNGRHTIFGKCKELDLIKKITSAPMQGERPMPAIVMKKVTITKE
jgi:peptidyl-prolyl cis-trans isomerase A (cyclophilin A)